MLTGCGRALLRVGRRALRHLAAGLTLVGAATYADAAMLPANAQPPTQPPAQPPTGHPERLHPDTPPSPQEQVLWAQIGEVEER